MLHNLHHVLDKAAQFAEQKKIDIEVLLNSRLAPDQFNFIRQVQIACDTAKFAAARIAGKEAPLHEDTEKTLPELIARVEKTISYFQTFEAADFDGAEEQKISIPRWEGKYLTGEEFVLQNSIPNFYFHVTTAYSILRHNGVDLGKRYFLGELPFKR
jgi:hypothetical protein